VKRGPKNRFSQKRVIKLNAAAAKKKAYSICSIAASGELFKYSLWHQGMYIVHAIATQSTDE